ncbi:sulfur carrier protein ThiS [Corynebacterium ciconiae DSM 44920]|uniref:sulfur carrier protein ThiS n=1 Tax=Corynebacterium ciconiae TaxID=227319 RepID=UPI000377057E|nr:sulfur carrier protein ThiS [Corynebacterium ciconiae]WKD61487.1 sulfur carrier protein ThiS [Corynebacterium ciconiae DSM 44920]
MFTLTINDTPESFASPTTVAEVVQRHTGSTETAGIAVAVDATVVPAADWSDYTLQADHTVDILTAAQGG